METPIEQTEKLLKATDVAEVLNISRSMSYRIIQRGEIRSVSIGRAKRVRWRNRGGSLPERARRGKARIGRRATATRGCRCVPRGPSP